MLQLIPESWLSRINRNITLIEDKYNWCKIIYE